MAGMELNMDTPLAGLAFLDAKPQKALASGGFQTAGQLLRHFPFRYEDRRQFADWPREAAAEPVCLLGEITDVQLQRFGYGKGFVEVTIEHSGSEGMLDPVVLRFFNMPWIYKSFAAGQEIIAYGKVKRASRNRLVIDHPEYEILTRDAEDARIHMQRIVPVYHARESVPQSCRRRSTLS